MRIDFYQRRWRQCERSKSHMSVRMQVGGPDPGSNNVVSVQVSWYPSKPCVKNAHIHVARSSGGRWKFPLQLTAEDSEVAGTVVCEAHMDRRVSVPVELYAPGA